MRNPERLNSFYDELKRIHKTYFPDWRFMQFIINYQRWQETHYHNDGFHLEEDAAMERIKEYIEWLKNW